MGAEHSVGAVLGVYSLDNRGCSMNKLNRAVRILDLVVSVVIICVGLYIIGGVL